MRVAAGIDDQDPHRAFEEPLFLNVRPRVPAQVESVYLSSEDGADLTTLREGIRLGWARLPWAHLPP